MRIAFFGDSLTEGRPGVSYVDILSARFPEHELLSFGHAGESVIGTHEQVLSLDGTPPFDLAFVWTGVNDVLARISWSSPIARALLLQTWTDSREEFVDRYRTLLESVTKRATRVVAVAPLFIGEDLANEWNQELDVRAEAIAALCKAFDNVEFVNLRSAMPNVGSGWCSSPFVEKSGIGTVWEVFALRTAEDVDRLSAERGLCYTLDGIHLNSRGAKAVAGALAGFISGPVVASNTE